MAGKLERLRVERTDGVDRPATGHRWVVVKSEDQNQKGVELAKALVEALAKDEQGISKDAASALMALAEHLGIELEAKAAEPKKDEKDEKDEPIFGEPAGLFKSSEDFEEKVSAIVAKTLAEALGLVPADEEPVAKGERLPTSKQPEGQDDVRKGAEGRVEKGQGLFEDIIFGQ